MLLVLTSSNETPYSLSNFSWIRRPKLRMQSRARAIPSYGTLACCCVYQCCIGFLFRWLMGKQGSDCIVKPNDSNVLQASACQGWSYHWRGIVRSTQLGEEQRFVWIHVYEDTRGSLNTIITDIEIKLYDPTNSAQKRTAIASVMLHLKVALSVTFNVGNDAEMDFRSLACLKQMEKIVGSISADKFKQLPPAWIRLFSSLDTFSSLAQKVAEVRRFAKSDITESDKLSCSLTHERKLQWELWLPQSKWVDVYLFFSFYDKLTFRRCWLTKWNATRE